MSDLEAKIKSWLSEQGYPLEMRVARTFLKAGFRTIQSDYYVDPESGVEREVDVIASTDHEVGDLLIRIEFVVECKRSTAKPWLLFTSPQVRLADPARIAQRLGSIVGRSALRLLCQDPEVQRIDLFELIGPHAYGATQAFTSGKDTAFEAMSSVSAAALGVARRYDEQASARFSIAKFVFPLVVIEGSLFEARLSDEGDDVNVSPIQEGTVIWRSQRVNVPHTIIPILSIDSLDGYAIRMRTACDVFMRSQSSVFLRARDEAKSKHGPRMLLA